jgi:hypothetical protein
LLVLDQNQQYQNFVHVRPLVAVDGA